MVNSLYTFKRGSMASLVKCCPRNEAQTYAFNPTFRQQKNFVAIRNAFLTDMRWLCKKYKMDAWIVFEVPPPPTPAEVAKGKRITQPRLHAHMKVWSNKPEHAERLANYCEKHYGNCTWKYADPSWDDYMNKTNDERKKQGQLWTHYYLQGTDFIPDGKNLKEKEITV